ncbi:MAG: Ig-like domain repeat protein [Propionibacteriaceae bacterium]|nr:Ig-like domain repeat protein [Propionibacteriaceae bacterium]
MSSKKIKRVAVATAVAGLLATIVPATSAMAATEPTESPSTSYIPVYLVDGENNVQYAPGTQLDWSGLLGEAHLSPIAVPETPADYETVRLPYVETAVQYVNFISDPGSEFDVSAWKAWGTKWSLDGEGALLPYVTPYKASFGQQAAVKEAGGTYSLGVAYLRNNGLQVVTAFFTTINVDAGTGAWKFATPTTVPEKETTTTEVAVSASPVRVGRPVTLTATVKKEDGSVATDAEGNVVFKRGSTVIETVGVANGQAVHLTQSLPVGTHAITAEYSGDEAFKPSTSAAAPVEVTDIAIPDEPTEGDPSFAANAVTLQGFSATVAVGAAYNGKAVNVFAYSEGQFIGQQTVANGSVTVDLRTLPAGEHTLVVTDDADDAILLWSTFTLDVTEADGSPANIPVHAAVRTSQDGDFKLVVPAGAEATLSNPALDPATGESVSTGSLPEFQVVDERVVNDRGWTLTTTVAEFVPSTDSSKKIANTALGLKPNLVSYLLSTDYYNDARVAAPETGAEQVAGTATYGSLFAELGAGKYNPDTKFDADLSFRAPVGSLAGTYNSTLTLTLVSK